LKRRSEAEGSGTITLQEVWLGYDGLVVPLSMISALLVYQPVWNRRIEHDYGHVPNDVLSVVLLHDGRVLPARRTLADLRARWSAWQATVSEQEDGAAGQLDWSADQDSGAPTSINED